MVITGDVIQAPRILDGTAKRESVGRLGVVAELPTDRLELLRRADAIGFKLSIVMPAFNEARTIREAIHAVLAVELSCNAELIVVDDGSTDATAAVVAEIDDPRLVKCVHPFNLGKGTAVRTGAAVASGTHLLIFDADSEYDPGDIPELIAPIVAGLADVVYGARIFGNHTVYPSLRFAIGNRATTLAANILFDSYITDLHTCLKLVPLTMFRDLTLTQRGFGLDSEITAELLRRGVRPFEVPVTYRGRSRAEGKKITWIDGIKCLAVLARVRSRGVVGVASGSVARRVPAEISEYSATTIASLEAELSATHDFGRRSSTDVDIIPEFG